MSANKPLQQHFKLRRNIFRVFSPSSLPFWIEIKNQVSSLTYSKPHYSDMRFCINPLTKAITAELEVRIAI